MPNQIRLKFDGSEDFVLSEAAFVDLWRESRAQLKVWQRQREDLQRRREGLQRRRGDRLLKIAKHHKREAEINRLRTEISDLDKEIEVVTKVLQLAQQRRQRTTDLAPRNLAIVTDYKRFLEALKSEQKTDLNQLFGEFKVTAGTRRSFSKRNIIAALATKYAPLSRQRIGTILDEAKVR